MGSPGKHSSSEDHHWLTIGAWCLDERNILHQLLTVQERQDAADARGIILEEMNGFPTWVERRKDLLSPGLQRVLERYLNAILECHYEIFHTVPDAVFSAIANRVAEACLRCNFRRAANSPVVASATPPRDPPPGGWHASRAQAYGFGPPHDPNLELALRSPPITTPPSTHLSGTLGIYAGPWETEEGKLDAWRDSQVSLVESWCFGLVMPGALHTLLAALVLGTLPCIDWSLLLDHLDHRSVV